MTIKNRKFNKNIPQNTEKTKNLSNKPHQGTQIKQQHHTQYNHTSGVWEG